MVARYTVGAIEVKYVATLYLDDIYGLMPKFAYAAKCPRNSIDIQCAMTVNNWNLAKIFHLESVGLDGIIKSNCGLLA